MPVRYQPGTEITATMVWGLMKVSATMSAAEADRPRYYDDCASTSCDGLESETGEEQASPGRGRQLPRPQLDICSNNNIRPQPQIALLRILI